MMGQHPRPPLITIPESDDPMGDLRQLIAKIGQGRMVSEILFNHEAWLAFGFDPDLSYEPVDVSNGSTIDMNRFDHPHWDDRGYKASGMVIVDQHHPRVFALILKEDQ